MVKWTDNFHLWKLLLKNSHFDWFLLILIWTTSPWRVWEIDTFWDSQYECVRVVINLLHDVDGRISRKWCQFTINHKTLHNLTSRPHMDKQIYASVKEKIVGNK